jgi:hypothetical protein
LCDFLVFQRICCNQVSWLLQLTQQLMITPSYSFIHLLFPLYTFLTQVMEHHRWVVNTPASYSGPGFKSWPGDRLSWLEFSWFSSVPPGKCWLGEYFKLDYDHFPPHPFQFIIHLPSFHSTLYGLSYWEGVVKHTPN